ncbi:unnamed protein product [Cunninghamella blakesleeana]
MPSTKEILPSTSINNDNNITVDIDNSYNSNSSINSRRASWPTTKIQQVQQQKEEKKKSNNNNKEEEEEEDPIWLKWKGTIGKQIGNLESSLGSMVGIHGLENNGQQWKDWGTSAIDRSNELTEQGAPSRIDGEYNRFIGHFGKALGHIIGDEEMEYNNVKRIYDANEEIIQSRKKSLE